MFEEVLFYCLVCTYFVFRYWLHMDTQNHLYSQIMDIRCEISGIRKEINQSAMDLRYELAANRQSKIEKTKQPLKKAKST